MAFELAPDAHRRAAALLEHLQRHPAAPAAAWVRPESLHVTLRFLGATDEGAPLEKALRSAFRRLRAPRVQLGPLGAFPRLGEARVLFQGVLDGSGLLVDAFHTFEREAQRLGFAPEPRPYHPHLTMARLRAPEDLRAWAEALDTPLLAPTTASLDHLTLFRSDALPGGSVYTPLARLPLG